MSSEIEVVSSVPAVRERSSVLLAPVMDVTTALARLQEFHQFCANYLQESKDGGNDGGDYGVIPGTKKKTLLKSGADKLCEVYGLADSYIIKETIDWDKGLFDFEMTCVLRSRRDDSEVGSGVGCCSSYESKYRYRDQQRKCPTCGKETIIKGKEEYGGGWLCFAKKGGCGAKFKTGDTKIENQVVGRVVNEDFADVKNTVYKMAKKRAKIDAVIGVTRSSGIFTQDLDDLPPIPPTKPEEPKTTEPIDLGGRGNDAAVTDEKGDGKVSKTEGESGRPPSPVMCAKAENTSFYAEVWKALPAELKPMHEDWGRAWLKDAGHISKDAKGVVKGSLKNTPKSLFPIVMKEVMASIDKLKASIALAPKPQPELPITDDDVPF